MKVVIIGAGRVGYGLAKALSLAENDVSIIDHSLQNIATINEKLDVKAIHGHATDIEALKEAGVDNADYLIAVISSDEANLVACALSNMLFNVKNKIIRINNRSLLDNPTIFDDGNFSADLVVCPDIEISEIIRKNISIPGALSSVSCCRESLRLVGVVCQKNAPLANIQLKYIYNLISGFEIAIACIQRGNEIIIPKKTDTIYPEDSIYFMVHKDKVYEAMSFFGIKKQEYRDLVIIGNPDVSKHIVAAVKDDYLDVNIKIIASDYQDNENVFDNTANVKILYGNPLEKEILDMADIANAGFVVAMTNDDRINMLSCLMAKKLGARRVSAIITDSSYSDVIYSLGISDILDSRQIIISKILNFIRKGGTKTIVGFNDGTEIMSINVFDSSHAIGCITDDISVLGELLIIAIKRNDKILLLPQKTLIQAGDEIIFIAKKSILDRIMKFFQDKPRYLL